MLEKFNNSLVVLLITNILSLLSPINKRSSSHDDVLEFYNSNKSNHQLASNYRSDGATTTTNSFILFAEGKGVAGLGKAGGDGSGGSDKAGQQVPPEVYNALTYAGTAFLLTLSVPLILYGLNKLLNRIEDCFGCGPSNRKKKRKENVLATTAAETATNSPDPQQLQNQKLHYQIQQQQRQQQKSYKLPGQSSLLTSANNNNNFCNNGNVVPQVLDQQQLTLPAHPADSTALPLDFNSEPHYKTSSLMQSNLQQQYIVSSTPNIQAIMK